MDPTTYRRSAYLREKRFNPSSIAIVIALHGAGLAALMLAKPGLIQTISSDPPSVELIDAEQDIPPVIDPPEQEVEQPNIPDIPRNPIDLDRTVILTPPDTTDLLPPIPPSPPPSTAPTPPADPIVIEARFDPAHLGDLQPDYPTILLRRELEGSVTVRVRIGADGRVKAVQRVRADHESFFEATRRHALRRWRFIPATRDGRPIESWQQHTVQFRIN